MTPRTLRCGEWTQLANVKDLATADALIGAVIARLTKRGHAVEGAVVI